MNNQNLETPRMRPAIEAGLMNSVEATLANMKYGLKNAKNRCADALALILCKPRRERNHFANMGAECGNGSAREDRAAQFTLPPFGERLRRLRNHFAIESSFEA